MEGREGTLSPKVIILYFKWHLPQARIADFNRHSNLSNLKLIKAPQ
jgi:hypothetical protein